MHQTRIPFFKYDMSLSNVLFLFWSMQLSCIMISSPHCSPSLIMFWFCKIPMFGITCCLLSSSQPFYHQHDHYHDHFKVSITVIMALFDTPRCYTFHGRMVRNAAWFASYWEVSSSLPIPAIDEFVFLHLLELFHPNINIHLLSIW